MKNSEFALIYITASGADEAARIAQRIVGDRLVACANLIENVRSIYWWEGRVNDEAEVVIVAKTRKDLVPEVIEAVKNEHSYEVPDIVAVDLVAGYQPYLDWIADETGGKQGRDFR